MKPLGILLSVSTDLFVEKRSVTQLLQGMIIELMERFLQESIMTLVSPKKSIFHAMCTNYSA